MEQIAPIKTARSSIAAAGMIQVFNPSTEELIGEVADSNQAAVDQAVARARESFEAGVWHRLGQRRDDRSCDSSTSGLAEVVHFLASPAGGWVTGQIIEASGGFRL